MSISSDRIEIDTDSRVTKIKCVNAGNNRTCDQICASLPNKQFFLQHVCEYDNPDGNGKKIYENALTSKSLVKKDFKIKAGDMCYCIPRFLSAEYKSTTYNNIDFSNFKLDNK